MNQVELVVDTIKKLGNHVRPLVLLVEVNRIRLAEYGTPGPSPLELDKILKQLYRENKFIYDSDGTIIWNERNSHH